MTKLELKKADLLTEKVDLIALGVYQEDILDENQEEDYKLQPPLFILDKSLNGNLNKLLIEEKFKGKLATTIVLPSFGELPSKKVLLIGLGKKTELKEINQLRKAMASGIRQAFNLKVRTISLALFQAEQLLDDTSLIRLMSEVCLLAPYKFHKYNTQTQNKGVYQGIDQINLLLKSDPQQEEKVALMKSVAICEGVDLARELIAEPPNIVNPSYLACIAEKIALECPDLEVKILNKQECEALKMGAFLAVGQGSINEPKLIHFHLSYS